MTGLIDIGLNLMHKSFDKNRDEIIRNANEVGVSQFIITGTNVHSSHIAAEYASKYPNIIYHGRLSFKDYLQLMGNTPFLLSTRNPTYPENQCNFPSKIIEALLHNRIVVSTLHYPQLDGINYFEVSHDVDNFVKDIESITSLQENQLQTYANQSDVIAKRFSTEVWNGTMKRIEKLNKKLIK